MTVTGVVSSEFGTVEAETMLSAHGKYLCRIKVIQGAAEQGHSHSFSHHRIFDSERDAVLDGLHEGMVWLDLKLNHVFRV